MRNYLNNTFLKSKQNVNMPIVRALLKYDSSNFTLCPPCLAWGALLKPLLPQRYNKNIPYNVRKPEGPVDPKTLWVTKTWWGNLNVEAHS